jgi:hypothetical protein
LMRGEESTMVIRLCKSEESIAKAAGSSRIDSSFGYPMLPIVKMVLLVEGVKLVRLMLSEKKKVI